MITGNIKECEKYFSVNANFKAAFEYLMTLSADAACEPFSFEGFKGNISCPNTSDTLPDGGAKPFEAHRDYLDIHYVIDGSEGIGYANVMYLNPTTEYNKENDYLLLEGEVNKLILHPGDFCVVFPEDAHIPAMKGDCDILKKAVVKIRV